MTVLIQMIILLMTVLGVGVILFSKNVIHGAYALALVLISIAGVYVFLNAEFLAVVQILLYAGGVVILLVFGVMMSNRMKGDKVMSPQKNTFVAAVVSITIFVILTFFLSSTSFADRSVQTSQDQIKGIGVSFLTEHIVAFELIAFILLVALVGASYLAKMSNE